MARRRKQHASAARDVRDDGLDSSKPEDDGASEARESEEPVVDGPYRETRANLPRVYERRERQCRVQNPHVVNWVEQRSFPSIRTAPRLVH